jgi:hypothetical protein
MEDPNITDSNPVTNKVQVNLRMLRPLKLNWVGGEVHSADLWDLSSSTTARCFSALRLARRRCTTASSSTIMRRSSFSRAAAQPPPPPPVVPLLPSSSR